MRILLTILLLIPGLSSATFSNLCDISLMPEPKAYSLSTTLKNFRLTPEMIDGWASQKLKVIVVGDHTKKLIALLLSRGVHAQQAKPGVLQFKEQSVDVLLYDQVLSYQLPEAREKYIENMMKLLKPGGSALIADFSAYLFHKQDMDKIKTLFGEVIEQSVLMVGEPGRSYPVRFLKLQRKKYDF